LKGGRAKRKKRLNLWAKKANPAYKWSDRVQQKKKSGKGVGWDPGEKRGGLVWVFLGFVGKKNPGGESSQARRER